MSSTHFGFETVDENDKARRVRGVFDSVASKYDIMNDLMSGGLHRAWKAYTVMVANLKEGDQVLDIAGGTGDLSLAFAKKVGTTGRVVHTDINEAMLRVGRDRLIDAGVVLPTLVCDAEKLPFPDAHFDVVSVAFAQHQGQPAAASIVLSVYAIGSCLAGLAFGALKLKASLPRQLLVCGVATALTTLPLLLVTTTFSRVRSYAAALTSMSVPGGWYFMPTSYCLPVLGR